MLVASAVRLTNLDHAEIRSFHKIFKGQGGFDLEASEFGSPFCRSACAGGLELFGLPASRSSSGIGTCSASDPLVKVSGRGGVEPCGVPGSFENGGSMVLTEPLPLVPATWIHFNHRGLPAREQQLSFKAQ